jgi:REP element-mobilizing transposase RayT
MARKPRIHFPGAVYHVILRGNAGHPVFFDDADRYRFYLYLQYAVEKFGCRIHSFCLMTNHIHLVVQTDAISLSRIMQNISLRYTKWITKWINYTQNRMGHLFQGRYKALLLDADRYLMELVRYIHLNPVRAGMVVAPDEYQWSGHAAYLGRENLTWLTTEWVLSLFSRKSEDARARYAQFVADGMGETRREEFYTGLKEGRILGDDSFADKALMKADQRQDFHYRIEDVVQVVCRSYGLTLDQLKQAGKARPYAEARAVAAYFVRELPGPSFTALGQLLGRDIASLGRAGTRIMTALPDDAGLNFLIEEIRKELLGLSESQA